MVEDLENEVTDLVSRLSTAQSFAEDAKKIDEMKKNLIEEREQKEKLESEKKNAVAQLAKLEAELKSGSASVSGIRNI